MGVFRFVRSQMYYINIIARNVLNTLMNTVLILIVFSNYAHKKGIAEPMNEWNLNILEKFTNLYCFAAFHPDDDNALKYAEQIISHPRVAGIKLHLQVQKFYPHR